MIKIHEVGNLYVTIFGISNIQVKVARTLIDKVRHILPKGVLIQATRADSVYGVDHIINALKIALESQKRKLLLADKLEVDLLLRIACVDQISVALSDIGLMYYNPACFILFSTQKRKLLLAAKRIGQCLSHPDNSVLLPNKMKRELISKRLKLDSNEKLQSDVAFTNLLSEKAALLNK